MITKPNFLVSISLQPDVENCWYFKLQLFDVTDIKVLKIQGLQHLVKNI